jgi:hypothetical protein
MPVHPFAVVVMSAGKADHLPRRHVLVAAVHRVGKETSVSVVEDLLEKVLTAALPKPELVIFEVLDDRVFLGVGQRSKSLAERLAAVGVQGGQRLAIMFRRRDVGLHPLLLGAVLKWTFHVEPAVMSIRARKLAVDEDGAAEVLAARRELIGGNQTIDDRLDGRSLLRVEIKPGAWLSAVGRVGAPGPKWKCALDQRCVRNP